MSTTMTRSRGRRLGALTSRWSARRAPVMIAFAILALALAAALVGPLVAPQDPNRANLSMAFQPPSSAYFLGTDGSGRDIFSRILAGARTAVLGPLLVALAATAAGAALGVTAAWLRGRADRLLSRGLDVMFAFPGLLIAILAVAMFGQGLLAPAVALAIVYTPYVARVVRAAAIREVSMPYVSALRLQGLPTRRVVSRHLVPGLGAVIAAQSALVFSYSLIDLAAVSFLGLGVQPPQADWGSMLASGQASILDNHLSEALASGLCVVLLILAVTVIAEWLSPDALDPAV